MPSPYEGFANGDSFGHGCVLKTATGGTLVGRAIGPPLISTQAARNPKPNKGDPAMTSDYVITGTISLLFLVLGLVFISGRGAFLIAGYNTMSKAKKEKYNEKALCRFVGWLLIAMIPCLLVTLAGTHFGLGWLANGGVALPIVLLVGGVIYVNTSGRFKK